MSAKEFKAVFPTSEWGGEFEEASLVIPHDALQFTWPPEAQSGDHESVTDVPSLNAGENLTASEENLTASDEAPGRAAGVTTTVEAKPPVEKVVRFASGPEADDEPAVDETVPEDNVLPHNMDVDTWTHVFAHVFDEAKRALRYKVFRCGIPSSQLEWSIRYFGLPSQSHPILPLNTTSFVAAILSRAQASIQAVPGSSSF